MVCINTVCKAILLVWFRGLCDVYNIQTFVKWPFKSGVTCFPIDEWHLNANLNLVLQKCPTGAFCNTFDVH